MPSLLLALDAIRVVLGQLFLVLGIGLALVCAIDWLVRTRRLNPFGSVSRLFRQSVEPLMAPVERRIVQAGGVPTHAPWWALGAVVVIGIVFLAMFDFVRSQLGGFYYASQTGPRGVVRMVIGWIFALLRVALIVRVFSGWVRVSPYSKWIRWSYTLSEPILRPLRQIVPALGMIDITPIIAYVLLSILEGFVVRLI